MALYKIEVTGAMYVDKYIEVEAGDEAGAFVAGDDQLGDWDEIHSRTIVAVGNIAVDPVEAHEFMDEIEAGFSFEPGVLEGVDLPAPDEELIEVLAKMEGEDFTVETLDVGDVDFYLDEDDEPVGVRVQEYEQDEEGM